MAATGSANKVCHITSIGRKEAETVIMGRKEGRKERRKKRRNQRRMEGKKEGRRVGRK